MSGESAHWLFLAAELQRAGDDPSRWPQAFAALCAALDCPGVFGDGLQLGEGPVAMIGRVAGQARTCAEQCVGTCGTGPVADESKRQTCLALLGNLDLALA